MATPQCAARVTPQKCVLCVRILVARRQRPHMSARARIQRPCERARRNTLDMPTQLLSVAHGQRPGHPRSTTYAIGLPFPHAWQSPLSPRADLKRCPASLSSAFVGTRRRMIAVRSRVALAHSTAGF